MNFDKAKIKAKIKSDMDYYTSCSQSGWTTEAILLDAISQTFEPTTPTIVEAADQIKASGETWDATLENETRAIIIEAAQDLFWAYYPSLWSQALINISPPLSVAMQQMPLLLK